LCKGRLSARAARGASGDGANAFVAAGLLARPLVCGRRCLTRPGAMRIVLRMLAGEQPMQKGPQIAVIGAGIGGLALAGLLSRQGTKSTVFEQAAAFEASAASIRM